MFAKCIQNASDHRRRATFLLHNKDARVLKEGLIQKEFMRKGAHKTSLAGCKTFIYCSVL